MTIKQHKVVVALPIPLEPDSIYYVRNGGGFDIHVTNNSGVVVGYELNASLDKVDKVAGKQLSDENYTLTEKQKLGGVADEATKNRADIENADKLHTHTTDDITDMSASGKGVATGTPAQGRDALELGTAATTNNGVGFGQNIINSAVSGEGNISYSETLLNNTTGINNIAVGGNALLGNTEGVNNIAVGGNALLGNTTGHSNTAVGRNALRANTEGVNNTAVGIAVLFNNTTGANNTAVGRNALEGNTTGRFNTAAGSLALLNNVGYDNCGGFGSNSQVTASNQIQLGDSATTVYTYGAVQNRSDARDKAEVRDTVLGLDFINAIRPVDYKLDMREDYRVELGEHPTEEQLEANKLANIQVDGTHTRKRYHHGVIAQEVASVIVALGVDFGGFQDHSKIGGDDVLSIGYEEFIAPLIKAVQELSTRVKELEGKVEELDDDLP